MGGYTLKTSPYSSHGKLLALVPEQGEGRRVLDLGCADGYLAELIARRGYEVVAVERAGVVREARGFRLVEADLEEGLPEVGSGFDYVLCADLLEHLRKPERLLGEIRGVLKPGGALLASLPNSGNLYFRLVVLAGRFPQEDRGLFDRTHVRFYTWDGWARLFEESGYRLARMDVTGIPVGLRFPERAQSPAVRTAEWVSYVMARLRKQVFAYQFVVVAVPT